jgi:hypothetical protein
VLKGFLPQGSKPTTAIPVLLSVAWPTSERYYLSSGHCKPARHPWPDARRAGASQEAGRCGHVQISKAESQH